MFVVLGKKDWHVEGAEEDGMAYRKILGGESGTDTGTT